LRRRSLDERLERLADLFEMGHIDKSEYLRKSDLLIERDQLKIEPAGISIALQRQQFSPLSTTGRSQPP